MPRLREMKAQAGSHRANRSRSRKQGPPLSPSLLLYPRLPPEWYWAAPVTHLLETLTNAFTRAILAGLCGCSIFAFVPGWLVSGKYDNPWQTPPETSGLLVIAPRKWEAFMEPNCHHWEEAIGITHRFTALPPKIL